jgi:uncharacterized XkdX family phage protein
MDWYKLVKDNYDAGFYTTDNVKVFVVKNKITVVQYKLITGVDYVA